MLRNQTLDAMMNRRSVRKYKAEVPDDETVETIVRAGQQAPFASQLYSVLRYTKRKAPFGAPLWFIVCVDAHKLERFMRIRGWDIVTNDLTLLLLGMQDASYAAENMVIAAESLGMGSCFLGEGSLSGARVAKIAKDFSLPPRVLPMVELVMGYPDEEYPARPRYPTDYALFEDEYPELSDDDVRAMMRPMDEGYLAQGYYAKQKAKIPIEGDREDVFTFDDYSWTEHISRKWGQWAASPQDMLKALKERGFDLGRR
ncbi:MAG: nitroreductase family protein [Spirochaetes bacterium]|nr:nitroreductase family protein [Spirochaetota bacterium]MBU1081222.1 nitroreductase family protein [Spirochaetota bacterium]